MSKILGVQTKGASTNWIAFSPTLTNVTLGTGSASSRWFWRRDKKNLEITGAIFLGTGGTITGNPTFTIPAGLAIDYTVEPGNDILGNYANVGYARIYDTSTATNYDVAVFTNANSATVIKFGSTDNTVGEINGTSPMTWAAGDQYHVRISVPIIGWSANDILRISDDTKI